MRRVLFALQVCALTPVSWCGSARADDVKAGPIWNNEDSKLKCPVACTAVGGRWDGQWRTTVWGKMSVCSCGDLPSNGCSTVATASRAPTIEDRQR